MATFTRFLRRRRQASDGGAAPAAPSRARVESAPVDIPPDDPIIAYFQTATGAVDIDNLVLDSPALAALREAGMKVVVPLVSQG
jgi:hypothetical protein